MTQKVVYYVYYYIYYEPIDSSVPPTHRARKSVARCKMWANTLVDSTQEVFQSIRDSIYTALSPSLFLHPPLCGCGPYIYALLSNYTHIPCLPNQALPYNLLFTCLIKTHCFHIWVQSSNQTTSFFVQTRSRSIALCRSAIIPHVCFI